MGIDPGALVVILLYALALAVILFVSPRLMPPDRKARPWFASVRLWASLVAAAQIVVYALWG